MYLRPLFNYSSQKLSPELVAKQKHEHHSEPMRHRSFVTCHWRKARENSREKAREQRVITFCLLSYWLSKWCKVFFNQSHSLCTAAPPLKKNINGKSQTLFPDFF